MDERDKFLYEALYTAFARTQRTMVGNAFSEEEVKQMVETKNEHRKEQLMEIIGWRPLMFRNWLAYSKEELQGKNEKAPYRSAVCAHFIMEKLSCLDELMGPNHENEKDFAFWHDFSHGMLLASCQLGLAETEVKGNFEESHQENHAFAEAFLGVETPVLDEVAIYINEKKKATGARRLFLKDGKLGFVLLDGLIDEMRIVKDDPRGHTFFYKGCVPEFVVAGAEFFRDVYKAIYPLSKNLGKPH